MRALVQVDPTSDVDDPVLDSALAPAPWLVRLVTALTAVGLPDPVFSPGAADLPEPDATELRRNAFRSAASLRAARDELAQLEGLLRVAVRTAPQPRLLLSADRAVEPRGALTRRVTPMGRARAVVEHMQGSHRATAERNGGRWELLPHTHGGLVFTERGARDTAAKIRDFVRGLQD